MNLVELKAQGFQSRKHINPLSFLKLANLLTEGLRSYFRDPSSREVWKQSTITDKLSITDNHVFRGCVVVHTSLMWSWQLFGQSRPLILLGFIQLNIWFTFYQSYQSHNGKILQQINMNNLSKFCGTAKVIVLLHALFFKDYIFILFWISGGRE